MRYDNYRYLWPARPERAIPPDDLPAFEARGWWAQAKLNGTNCTLYTAPSGTTLQRGRHGDTAIKSWTPGESWNAIAVRMGAGAGWYVIQAELLHTKGTGRDTLYLHDMLVEDGQYLVGTTYKERYFRLAQLCGVPVDARGAPWLEVNDGVWLAGTFDCNFRHQFDRLRDDKRVEGLVVKDPNAKLALCSRPTSNSSWQIKSRYPKANLSF